MKLFLTAALVLLAVSATLPAQDTLAPDLKSLGDKRGKETIAVIVQFKPGTKAKARTRLLSRGAAERLDLGGAVLYDIPANQLAALAADPAVEYITPDRAVTANLDFIQPTVRADVAFTAGITGKGIGIAMIDSGVSAHKDLSKRIVYEENFVAGEKSSNGEDTNGHGTFVAGVLAGDGNESNSSNITRTFRGMASAAQIINLRVLDANGTGTDSQVIAAINRAIALKTQYNIRVINLSLGRPVMESYRGDPLDQAVNRAVDAGIVVVVAAGNYGRDNTFGTRGYGLITSPGNHPRVITVGAMKTLGTVAREDDQIASYSSKGPTIIDYIAKPDIVAPGNRVASLLASRGSLNSAYPANLIPVSYYKTTGNTNTSSVYFRMSGTSVATPVVSGAVALMLQKDPTLSPDTVKARLMKTDRKSTRLNSSHLRLSRMPSSA